MLSILIPAYDQPLNKLVKDLLGQVDFIDVDVEIIISDQCPNGKYVNENEQLNTLPGVRYSIWTERRGRSANRNHLADLAQGDFLLFIDADAGIVRPDFLKVYWSNREPGKAICASVYYDDRDPGGDLRLRWKYGKKREMRPIEERLRNPYKAFSAFTFLMAKSDFQKVRFDERINEYGHEDTIFGKHLQYAFIKIKPVDLPLRHEGLISAEAFLTNTRHSVENLAKLCKLGLIDEDVRLYRTQQQFAKAKADWLIGKMFPIFESLLKRNLLGKNPSLRAMDLYKLGYFCSLINGRKTDSKTLRS